ncbi:hypothetical protein PHPALM_28832 [Phytophthora palmivora]|uniref:SET domain-containing protein n=1 Tax=Phytophthora palmivora TaxID=4796 RepID=A0A2P4X926_9STRA|nr:hypothetical protein PHPALM_28832 [Phytophthora palmivora]
MTILAIQFSMSTIARFINHSCDPNTEFIEMRHNREVQVMVIATRPILRGDEVTIDYGEDLWFNCGCESGICRGGNPFSRVSVAKA